VKLLVAFRQQVDAAHFFVRSDLFDPALGRAWEAGGSTSVVSAATTVARSRIQSSANLKGGTGTAFGAVTGAALIEVIRNSLLLLGVDAFWQGTFVGSFIVLAVMFDKFKGSLAD
jgi:ribose transport system permease protein